MQGENIEVTKEWRRLMKAAKQIGFGRLEIIVQDGKPVMIEVPLQQVKLNGPEDETDKFKTIII